MGRQAGPGLFGVPFIAIGLSFIFGRRKRRVGISSRADLVERLRR